MIPQIDIPNIEENIEIVKYPSRTYADKTKAIRGYIDNIEAIKQTVHHIIYTERYAYPIYPDNYGMELNKYIGRPFEYLQATIEKDLRDALTQDDRIDNIVVTNITKQDLDTAIVEFDVYSVEGLIQEVAKIGL